MRRTSPIAGARAGQRGFTLLEIALVMVVIGVLYAAVTSGAEILRSAKGQRLLHDFVFAWTEAFLRHVKEVGVVPGDNVSSPQYIILTPSGGRLLCNQPGNPELSNTFLGNSVSIPAGDVPGEEAARVYQDSRGSPHVLTACMRTTGWSVPGFSVGTFQTVDRHVLVLRGLTTELAAQFDSAIDGRADARYGRFRSAALAASGSPTGSNWPAGTAGAEGWATEVEAYLDMSGN
jgi:prepilin-type N-terminal cleavage/methylation domain-containing protein